MFSGIFVSRFNDSAPTSVFSGLLGVGDEILEMNGRQVHNLAVSQIRDTMTSSDRLTLKTLPFLARKET